MGVQGSLRYQWSINIDMSSHWGMAFSSWDLSDTSFKCFLTTCLGDKTDWATSLGDKTDSDWTTCLGDKTDCATCLGNKTDGIDSEFCYNPFCMFWNQF